MPLGIELICYGGFAENRMILRWFSSFFYCLHLHSLFRPLGLNFDHISKTNNGCRPRTGLLLVSGFFSCFFLIQNNIELNNKKKG